MRILAVIAVLLSCATVEAAQAAGVEGRWAGVWTKNGDALPVIVTFRKDHTTFLFDTDVYAGSFSSDALQQSDIPFSEVLVWDPGRIHFTLTGDATTTAFDGTLNGDVLAGTFTEGNVRGTFQLHRLPSKRVAAAGRDVTFSNGDVTLSGTLVMPTTPGVHPAVVLLHGSGAEARSTNDWLAQKFAERGIAALIYDTRGVGNSTGDWKTATFEDLAADAVAGIRMLRSQHGIDPKRIGIYGHSQGAAFAPLVAERAGDVAFVVVSAPTETPNIAAYPPLDHWRRVHVPVLLVFGAHDGRGPAPESARAIETVLKAAQTPLTVRVFQHADRTFTIVDPKPPPGTWPKREPDYAQVLTDWALAQR